MSPDNIYGNTKLKGERLAPSCSGRSHVVVIRVSETSGPDDRRLLKPSTAVKKSSFVTIDGESRLYHPIYIDDLTERLRLAAAADGVSESAFVLPGADVVTTREMADAIASALGNSMRGIRAPLPPDCYGGAHCHSGRRVTQRKAPYTRERWTFSEKASCSRRTTPPTPLASPPADSEVVRRYGIPFVTVLLVSFAATAPDLDVIPGLPVGGPVQYHGAKGKRAEAERA